MFILTSIPVWLDDSIKMASITKWIMSFYFYCLHGLWLIQKAVRDRRKTKESVKDSGWSVITRIEGTKLVMTDCRKQRDWAITSNNQLAQLHAELSKEWVPGAVIAYQRPLTARAQSQSYRGNGVAEPEYKTVSITESPRQATKQHYASRYYTKQHTSTWNNKPYYGKTRHYMLQ